jgi:hypothetical protein
MSTLVDDGFVRKAIESASGLTAFGVTDGWTRTERIAVRARPRRRPSRRGRPP